MRTVNMHEAKTHLSRLVDEVTRGESVVIANRGRPVARLVAIDSADASPQRRTGFMNGRIVIPDDFDRLDEDAIVAAFEARS